MGNPMKATLPKCGVILMLLIASACGDDDSGDAGDSSAVSSESVVVTTTQTASSEISVATSEASPAGDPGVAAAAEMVAQYETLPTAITQTEPLTGVPEKKTLAFIACQDPTCVQNSGYVKEAAEALGWDFLNVNAGADIGAAVQQAIDANVDFLTMTGFGPSAFPAQAQIAMERNIPILIGSAVDIPEGPDNGLFASINGLPNAEVYTSLSANWAIVDSEGTANILMVDLPEYPILTGGVDGAMKSVADNCPECEAEVLDLTVQDLVESTGPQKIVSYLQSNPDVGYVLYAFRGLSTGVTSALEGAGLLERVKQVGIQGDAVQFQEIVDGKSAQWSALPQEYQMWSIVDQAARIATGQWTLDKERSVSTQVVMFNVDTVEAAEQMIAFEQGWPGPEGFKEQFIALWGT